MENWEQKLNHVDAPDSSVPSHRQALRNKLHSTKPRARMRASVLAATLVFVVGLTGLTVANPNWVNDVVRVVRHEAFFTSADGKQEYHIQTMEIEGPADSVAAHMQRMGTECGNGEWTFDPADPANAELLKKDGAKKMVFVEADVTDKGDGSGPMEKTMVIESRDGGKTFTVNGEKTITAEELKAMHAEHGQVERIIEGTDTEAPTFEAAPQLVGNFELKQNYPNPFNPTTQIPFELKEGAEVSLKVFDLTGREVATLVNGYQSAGSHTVSFDGSNLATGTYLYLMKVGDNQFSRTMILMK
ncbi:MAG: T9SS type A sorting domain-containing protein [bacterium]|nr:T9SS type A sorting domain-containing protein [bacterium]MBK8127541.1 T9SS type A sorting domain-containing protein [bacterium]